MIENSTTQELQHEKLSCGSSAGKQDSTSIGREPDAKRIAEIHQHSANASEQMRFTWQGISTREACPKYRTNEL
jgi:hypothetical protein